MASSELQKSKNQANQDSQNLYRDEKQEYLEKYAINFALPNTTITILLINYYIPACHKIDPDSAKQSIIGQENCESSQFQDDIRYSKTYAYLNNEEEDERQQKDSENSIHHRKRIQDRKSAIIFVQEAPSSFKILFERVFQSHIQVSVKFSPDGNFLAYIPPHESQTVHIVKTSTLDDLLKLQPIAFINHSIFENVKEVKFSLNNKYFAKIYQKRVEFFNLQSIQNSTNSEDIYVNDKKTLKIPESYQFILGVEFDNESDLLNGKIAMKPIDSDSSTPAIHVLNFENDQLVITIRGLRVIKLENLYESPSNYMLKFTSDLKQVIISTCYDRNSEQSERNYLYTYDIDQAQLQTYSQKQPIQWIAKVENFDDNSSLNPFITLNANDFEKQCYIFLGENQSIPIDFMLSPQNCKIVDMYAALTVNNEVNIKVAFLMDQEKLCHFSFTQKALSQFDQLLDTYQKSNTNNEIIEEEENQKKSLGQKSQKDEDVIIEYREFQEYSISNFSYPYISYNDLSKQIRIKILDGSKDSIVVKMPQLKGWSKINQIRIVDNQAFFLVENNKEILVFQYEIETQRLATKNGEPLLKISKAALGQGASISDFWIYSKDINQVARFLPIRTSKSVAFYFTTVPDNKMYAYYLIQNIPQLELLGTGVKNFFVKQARIYFIKEQKELISFAWRSQKTLLTTHFKEMDGEILSFIQTNQNQKVWIFSFQGGSNYYLKSFNFDSECSQTNMIDKIFISDSTLIKEFSQCQRRGYIESTKDGHNKLYISGDNFYSLETIINGKNSIGENNESLRCKNILDLEEQNEYVMSSYPQVNIEYQKTLFIIKSNKSGNKKGLILPSLISDNRIKHESNFMSKKHKENTISFLLPGPQGQKQVEDKHLICKLNIGLKQYQILNIKGQILRQEELQILFQQDYGRIVALSNQVKLIAGYNQQKNLITIFKLIVEQTPEMYAKLETFWHYNIIDNVQNNQFKKLEGIFIESIQKQAKIEQLFKTTFQINNKGDLLMIIENTETKQKDLYLYECRTDCQYQKDIISEHTNINFPVPGDQQIIKGCYISSKNVIAWYDTCCFVYHINSKHIRQLSLSYDKSDNLQILEVIEIENYLPHQLNKEQFIIRIENTLKTHMIIVWDETTKSEQCSTDVSSASQILFDSKGHSFIIDYQFGLMEMIQNSACAKNLAFRKVLDCQSDNFQSFTQLKNQQGAKVKVIVEYSENAEQYRKQLQEKNLKIDPSYIMEKIIKRKTYEYIMIDSDIILPHSFLQLIINQRIQKINKRGAIKQKASLQNFEYLITKLSPQSFNFQMKAGSIFHTLAPNFKQLEIVCQYLAKKDPQLLDLLLIKNSYMKTPLEIAIESKNSRSVNLIMAMIAEHCQETFGKSTNIFKKHFTSLIDSQCFGQFLESAFFQSEQYAQITSFSAKDIEKVDGEGVFQSHYTVSKDKGFNEKFQDPDLMNERNVNVHALRADWILKTPEGYQFLQELSKSENMDLFQLESIKTIVLYQWGFYKPIIIKKLYFPFLIYFTAFIFSITLAYQGTTSKPIMDDNYNIANFLLVSGLVMPLQLYFLYKEIKQLKDQGVNYFSEFWNYLDVVQLIAAFIISVMMITHRADSDSIYINLIGSVCVIILYLKFFYYLRLFDSTNNFIRMIVQITYDIRIFLYIYFLTVIGFGNGLYLLSKNNEKEENQFIESFPMAIMFVYRMALGDFDTEKFGKEAVWMVWIIFIISTLLIMIVLLNLLIAIMGDTFGRVKETEESSRIREYLQLLLDNSFLVNRYKLFKDVKFIICIKMDRDAQNISNNQEKVAFGNQIFNEKIIENINLKLDEMKRNQSELREFIMKEFEKKQSSEVPKRKKLAELRTHQDSTAQIVSLRTPKGIQFRK